MFQLAWLACKVLGFSCLCLAMFGIHNIHPCPTFLMGGAGDWDSVPMFVNRLSYPVIIFESLFCQNDFKIISLLASFVVVLPSSSLLYTQKAGQGRGLLLFRNFALHLKFISCTISSPKSGIFSLYTDYLFLQGADVKKFTKLGQSRAHRLRKCTHVFSELALCRRFSRCHSRPVYMCLQLLPKCSSCHQVLMSSS